MRYLGIWVVATLITRAVAAHAASAELHLSSLVAGGTIYSNAIVSASSADRVVIRHTGGIGTVKISGLDTDVRQQLAAAGIISGSAAKDASPQKVKTRSKLKVLAESFAESQTARPDADAVQAEENSSFAKRLETRIENEARAHGRGSFDPKAMISMLSYGVVCAIFGGLLALYLLRCWCLFRICKRSTGRGSLLVFVPLFRWLPLVKAAHMTRRWLWVPTFGTVALYLPPPLPHMPWLAASYATLLAVLWVATLVLFGLWCLRICAAVNCTPWLGILLFLPVLDWIGLCYLAFSKPKLDMPMRIPVVANRPALAFELP